jgi:hypothetical protein
MMFGGIAKHYKTPLIQVEGAIDSIAYIDDCIDASGLIPEMNQVYGARQWFLVQDGATCHKSAETSRYLKDYCDVIENWPSGSPNLNPIENLWYIIKMQVEEAAPETIDKLRDIAFKCWEEIESSTIDHLIDSMECRIALCFKIKGDHIGY